MYLRGKNIKIVLVLLVASVILLLNSCNAPRENPLDPDSADNHLGTIEGMVETFSLPYTPIENVEIIWKPGNMLVYSDKYGNFSFTNVKTEDGPLIFRKDGYHPDTVQVVWAGTRKISEQVNLNKIPTVDSLFIYSSVTNTSNPPGSMSELVIKTKITDIDNDIDTVFVVNDQLELNKAMDFNVASKTFETELTSEELNLTDLEQSVGLQFNFRVRDVLGESYLLNGGSVKRVIKDQVTGMMPANDQVITSVPFDLTWTGFTSGYSFTYMIEIYTNDGSQLILSADNIPSQVTKYAVNSLDSGNYYWVIWIIDDFNDMARSVPATFSVQ